MFIKVLGFTVPNLQEIALEENVLQKFKFNVACSRLLNFTCSSTFWT